VSFRSRTSYLAVTAAVAAGGGLAAGSLELGASRAVWLGLAAAWALQAPSFWRLAGTLARGEAVLRDWVGGMALRFGGLALLVVAGGGAPLPTGDMALAYAAALLAFLGLEIVWLLRRQPELTEPADGRHGAGSPDSGDGGPAPAAGERPGEGADGGHRSRIETTNALR
jgi:hypothetical protein